MKVPFTPLAQKLVIRKLMAMHADGWDANASLEKSAIYGYRGVFEVSRKAGEKQQRDPALEKMDADAKRAVPIPANIRAQIATLTNMGVKA